MNKIFHLLYCWAHKFPVSQSSFETSINNNDVSSFYIQFRNASTSYLVGMPNKLIGNPGKTVEIDETLMCKRKYHRGRLLLDAWIFGGICREDNHILFC